MSVKLSRRLWTYAPRHKDLPDRGIRADGLRNDGPSRTEQSISYKFRIERPHPSLRTCTTQQRSDDTICYSHYRCDSSPMAAFDLHDPADGLWFVDTCSPTPTDGEV